MARRHAGRAKCGHERMVSLGEHEAVELPGGRDDDRWNRAGNDATRVAQGHSSDVDTVHAVEVGGAAALPGQPSTAANRTRPGTAARH